MRTDDEAWANITAELATPHTDALGSLRTEEVLAMAAMYLRLARPDLTGDALSATVNAFLSYMHTVHTWPAVIFVGDAYQVVGWDGAGPMPDLGSGVAVAVYPATLVGDLWEQVHTAAAAFDDEAP